MPSVGLHPSCTVRPGPEYHYVTYRPGPRGQPAQCASLISDHARISEAALLGLLVGQTFAQSVAGRIIILFMQNSRIRVLHTLNDLPISRLAQQ
jgi:hypothetical protein